nr:HAD family phosphatase [Enterococcus lactis]
MDGVLIDSENFYFDRRMQFFKEKNILPGSTNKLDFVGLTENGIWEVLVSEKDQRADLKKEYLAYWEKHPIDFKTALRKGAEDILDYLKKKSIKIALASSSPQREIDKMLTQNADTECFSTILRFCHFRGKAI